jgi:hypothetical protein
LDSSHASTNYQGSIRNRDFQLFLRLQQGSPSNRNLTISLAFWCNITIMQMDPTAMFNANWPFQAIGIKAGFRNAGAKVLSCKRGVQKLQPHG